MSSDNQFTALGPADVGFQTNSNSISIGANIAGNNAGVIGSSVGTGVQGIATKNVGHTNQQIGVQGLCYAKVVGYGVYGQSDWGGDGGTVCVGVFGTSGVGVYAQAQAPNWIPNQFPWPQTGEGVVGDGPTTGVHGRSAGSPNHKNFPVPGTGVAGEGGIGVYGLGSFEGVVGDGDTGVHGRGGPLGVGVIGEGGIGVHGLGTVAGSRGGVFESVGTAQLRIVPAPLGTLLPPTPGLPGDIFARIEKVNPLRPIYEPRLYLCIGPGYRQIQVGDIVQGGT
jgi:hypothetical protein